MMRCVFTHTVHLLYRMKLKLRFIMYTRYG